VNAHDKLVAAKARLEEARWWIKHLESHGDEILDSDRARISDLETMVQDALHEAMER